MLGKNSSEPKFYSYFRSANFKYSPKQSQAIRQQPNPLIMNGTFLKKYDTGTFPKYNHEELVQLILKIANQMDQVGIKNFSFDYLLDFVHFYFKELVEILVAQSFHCGIFCLTLCRFLQQVLKTNGLDFILQKVKSSQILNLLINIYKKAKINPNLRPKGQAKETHHYLSQAILGFASIKYICQQNHQQSKQEEYINTALRISAIVIESVYEEAQFEAVRDFVVYVSHLLIFNPLKDRPKRFYEFCIYKDSERKTEENIITEEIKEENQKEFFQGLQIYAKMDPQYLDTLLNMIKNLLETGIKNEYLIKHYSVLMKIVKTKLFPRFKLNIYKLLLQIQEKKCCQQSLVDLLYEELLDSDPDLCFEMTQNLNLKLCLKGNIRRKQKFVQKYYSYYTKNNNKRQLRLQTDTIKCIFQVNLDLGLQLPDFQVFLEKEAGYIGTQSIKKLHQTIFNYKKLSHLKFLENILRKRIIKNSRNIGQMDLTSFFLKEDWLQAAGDSWEVYQIYLRIMVETVTSKTITPENIKHQNINSLTIQINNDYFPQGLRYYIIISKMATKNKIFSPLVFKNMLICQAVFGDNLKIALYQYFYLCFQHIFEKDATQILEILQFLVITFKNRPSIILYFQALLQFQRSNRQFYRRKLYVIKFLAHLTQTSLYFKLSSYSIEAVTILQELTTIIKEESFQTDATTIFKAWSGIMTKNECTNFCYLFCFREMKKVFPFLCESESENRNKRIIPLWNLMIELMDHETQPIEFLKTAQNKVRIDWVGDPTVEKFKKGLKIDMGIVRNQKMSINWDLITLITSSASYQVQINNDMHIVYHQSNVANSKKTIILQVLNPQFNKMAQEIDLLLKIQQSSSSISNSKATVMIAGQLLQIFYEGYLKSIVLKIASPAYIKKLSAMNTISGNTLSNLSKHLNQLDQWTIKVSSLSKIVQNSLINKVDFQLVFCLLRQVLKNTKQYNFSQGFKMLTRFSCRLFKFLKKSSPHQSVPYELRLMVALFSQLKQEFPQRRGYQFIDFAIQLNEPTEYSYYLYHFYLSALLPREIWLQFSSQTKKYLMQLLLDCTKQYQFKVMQNSTVEFFELLCRLDYDLQAKTQIAHEIIMKHELNTSLTLKFQHYVSLALQSRDVARNFTAFLCQVISFISSDNPQYHKKKALCKYLLFQRKILDIFFHFCQVDSKISLIYYLLYQPIKKGNDDIPMEQQIQKIKDLISLMSHQQKGQFVLQVIAQLKLDSKPKRTAQLKKSIITSSNQLQNKGYINLQLLIQLWDSIDKNSFEDVITILSEYLRNRLKLRQYDEPIHILTENTLCTQEYIDLLFKIQTQHKKQNPQYQKAGQMILQYSFELIARSQLKKFLKFMSYYQGYAVKDLSFALIPISIRQLQEKELYSYNVILQYIYEILACIKHSKCFDSQKQGYMFCKSAKGYIEWFVSKIAKNYSVRKALVYVYPKLKLIKQAQMKRNMMKLAEKQAYFSLHGGIYFKLIVIVVQLLELCIQDNFMGLIEVLFLRKDSLNQQIAQQKQKKSKTDHLNNSNLTRLDSQLDKYQEEHQRYYQQTKKSLFLKPKISKQSDLSYSLLEYFMMRLCKFLQNNSAILSQSILKSYSNLVLFQLKHPKISKQLDSENQLGPSQIYNYKDMLNFYQNPGQSVSLNTIERLENIVANFMSSNNVSNPSSQIETHYLTLSTKQRLQLCEKLHNEPRNWGKIGKVMNLTKRFGVKPNQILFHELLLIHNVLKRPAPKPFLFRPSFDRDLASFQNNHKKLLQRQIKQRKQLNKFQFDNPLKKVKKIYPYTVTNKTVMRMKENTFPNMACPITQLIQCKTYELRDDKSQMSLNMKTYLQQDYSSILAPIRKLSSHDYLNQIEISQELRQSVAHFNEESHFFFCELITREGAYFCEWELQKQTKVLKLKSLQNRPDSTLFPNVVYGSDFSCIIRQGQLEFLIPLSQVQQIFYRKFAQTFNSIEIFMKKGKSKFILFYKPQIAKLFLRILQSNHQELKVVREPAKEFAKLNFTQRWIQGKLSNFDYIMMLNKYSGRSHNDLNQYYIFPWVLKDYKSEKLDLTDAGMYRDLSKPMGAQNPKKLKYFKQNCNPNKRKSAYGCYYSVLLFTLHYLLRLEPFVTAHRKLHKTGSIEKFDHPDRLFNSIAQFWDILMDPSSRNSIQELTPQFYYMPVFLVNVGNIELGTKGCGNQVHDVDLPPWASSPEQFVLTLRAALQSDQVSENLHLWIDLIFGKHQYSQQKSNVFLPQVYEQKAQEMLNYFLYTPAQIQTNVQRIMYIGQSPSKLFHKEHKPKKTILSPVFRSLSRKAMKPLSQTAQSDQYEQVQIMEGWKFSQVYLQNNSFHLQLQSNISNRYFAYVIIDLAANSNQIKESFDKLKAYSKTKAKVERHKSSKLYLNESCLKIDQDIILPLQTNFTYSKVKTNEMWIVCYGLAGVRVYNWQQSLFWQWQKEEVSSVYLQPTRMIFSTPSGKVCFYSFFDGRLHVIQAFRQCYTMHTKVVNLPRLPSDIFRNYIQYKVFCVGDQKKITILDYVFQQTLNQTSLAFSAAYSANS